MSAQNLKNSIKFQSNKLINLEELSISNIWDNKYQDESSDFQHERYLINTIRTNNIDPEHEYGLKPLTNRQKDPLANPPKKLKIETLNKKYMKIT